MARLLPVGERDGMDTSDPCSWAAPFAAVRGRVALARAGERAAAEHLAHAHGLVTVATNVRVAVEDLRGELDVIATHGSSGLLVVCEVKARTRTAGAPAVDGGAVEALGARQRARIRRMTALLLAAGTLRARMVRFDLVTVDVAGDHDGRSARCRHLAGAW